MGVRQFIIDWLEAGRAKSEPERKTDAYPFPFGNFMSFKGNQPTMKRTPANLRLLSESPIPRRAINVIKDGIAQLPWAVVAIDEQEQEKYRDICNNITNALRKPNPSDSFRLLIEQVVEDMLVASAGSIEILKAGDPRRPFRLYAADAFSIELFPDWDGKRDSYRYAQRDNGKYIFLTDADLIYIRMNPRSNTPFGLSPMETVWEQVQFFINSNKYAGRQTSNSLPKKMLNIGSKAGDTMLSAFRAYWTNEVMGRGITPIIGSDNASTIDLGATDDSMLFLAWQRFLIEIVAISFGISPKKLGQTKDVNRGTAESEDEDTDQTIRSIADNIAEHINTEIIEARFGLGHAIEFRFQYAASLKDKKTKAEIDAIYLDRGALTLDEVRGDIGKKPHPNGNGEIILIPSASRPMSINQPLAEQIVANPAKITAHRLKAYDQASDTQTEEKQFMIEYLSLMRSVRKRGANVSFDNLVTALSPSLSDVRALADDITRLYSDVWLVSYNRRRIETGGSALEAVPIDVTSSLERESLVTANEIMGTYESDLKNKLETLIEKHSDKSPDEMQKDVVKELEAWSKNRAKYKAEDISITEAGKAWNMGLFAHDDKYAPNAQYTVLPETTEHEACAEIIAGAPYTRDTIPAPLTLHTRCPHRYYAITESLK